MLELRFMLTVQVIVGVNFDEASAFVIYPLNFEKINSWKKVSQIQASRTSHMFLLFPVLLYLH